VLSGKNSHEKTASQVSRANHRKSCSWTAPAQKRRTREYLTPDEVKGLIDAVRDNRHGHRDATMILMTYRHGLRAAELVDQAGAKSTWTMRACMCGELRMVCRAFI
jgi:site-specific recombinase XerD